MNGFRSWSVRRWLTYLNLAICISYLGLLAVAARQDLLWRADFTAYYTGALLVREGHAARLYDLELQTQIQQRVLGGRSFYGGVLPYNYPPYFALLLLPLAYFSLPQAFALWTTGSIIALAWVIRLVYAQTATWSREDRGVMIGVIVALPALLRSILQGTSTVWALLCVLLVYRALKGSDLASGAGGVVVGTIRPQSILPVGLFVVLQRRWHLIGTSLIGGLVIFGLTTTVFGLQIWVDFLISLARTGHLFDELGVYPSAMINLRGVLALWLGSHQQSLISQLSWFGFILSLGVMAWLWRREIRSGEPSYDLRLALGLVLGYFFSFHLNPHDALLLAVPLLLLARYLHDRRESVPREMTLMGALPIGLLIADFLIGDFFNIRGGTLLILGITGWLLVLLRIHKLEIAVVSNAERMN